MSILPYTFPVTCNRLMPLLFLHPLWSPVFFCRGAIILLFLSSGTSLPNHAFDTLSACISLLYINPAWAFQLYIIIPLLPYHALPKWNVEVKKILNILPWDHKIGKLLKFAAYVTSTISSRWWRTDTLVILQDTALSTFHQIKQPLLPCTSSMAKLFHIVSQ